MILNVLENLRWEPSENGYRIEIASEASGFQESSMRQDEIDMDLRLE